VRDEDGKVLTRVRCDSVLTGGVGDSGSHGCVGGQEAENGDKGSLEVHLENFWLIVECCRRAEMLGTEPVELKLKLLA
jgi:hypothetical protein